MEEPIENLYFNWLYSKVCDVAVHEPSMRFNRFLSELHRIEFVWSVIGDDNRAEDGCDLRTEFLHEAFIHNNGELFVEGCSVFEMLVAFSRKASFETDESVNDWFWRMVENLGLSGLNDASFNFAIRREIADTIDTMVLRTYDHNGNGGLFPLHSTLNDQSKVEIWYQFSEYVAENNLV